jgi:hypothetical protein
MMTATDPGTGIYLVTVTTATGRVLEEVGDLDYLDSFLDELGSAETVLDVERHEMTEAEVDEYGPVWDSPGTSAEEDDF